VLIERSYGNGNQEQRILSRVIVAAFSVAGHVLLHKSEKFRAETAFMNMGGGGGGAMT